MDIIETAVETIQKNFSDIMTMATIILLTKVLLRLYDINLNKIPNPELQAKINYDDGKEPISNSSEENPTINNDILENFQSCIPIATPRSSFNNDLKYGC